MLIITNNPNLARLSFTTQNTIISSGKKDIAGGIEVFINKTLPAMYTIQEIDSSGTIKVIIRE